MRNLFLLFTIAGFSVFGVKGQVPTYNNQVSCILFEHCTSCHHEGGIAPFSLMTYDDATSAAFGLQGAVNAGTMPPWPPNPDYNSLAHERILSQEEIDVLNDWVNNGYPEGNATPPTPPVYGGSETITNPDLVLTMPQFNINTVNNDDYRCFVIPTSLSQDVYITDLEVVPGNGEAVHHVLLFQDPSTTPATLDADDPGPGYTSFGGTGSSESVSIGGWVPGQGARSYPDNMGVLLPAGSNIIMQVHYPTSANGQQDQTKVNIKYSTTALREVHISAPLNHGDLNEGLLIIPANQTPTFTAEYTTPAADITILDVGPHMHLLGKSIKSWAVTPTNQTIPFIEIEDWDFHWQGFYEFKNPIKIPAGSTFHSTATYDNTSSNPNNPSNPPQLVYVGEATTDEMMLLFFSWTVYFPGDENIVIDPTTTHESHACQELVGVEEIEDSEFQVFPNPATDKIWVDLSSADLNKIQLTDVQGKVVSTINRTTKSIDVSGLSEGVYFLTITTDSQTISQKVMVKH